MARLRLLLAALLAGAGAAAGPAQAGPTLLCQREEVLQIVERRLRAGNLYRRLDPFAVTELPMPEANWVTCLGYGTVVAYAATGYGLRPTTVTELHRWEVRVRGNRVYVQVLF